MGITSAIDFMIKFIILFILFMIGRNLIIPDQSLSVDELPPKHIVKPLWRGFISICVFIFGIIMAVIAVIWVFWHILKLIPIIGQIIIAVVPPFKQFERAGLFKFMDELIYSVFTLNIMGVIRAFANFFKRSSKRVIKNMPKSSTKSTQKNNESKIETESETTNENADQDSKFTPAQHKAVENNVQLCIAEKTIPVYDSMSTEDKIKARVSNNNVAIQCRAMSVADYSKIAKFE